MKLAQSLSYRRGEWETYSKHSSLVSARSRVHQIKRSKKYEGLPFLFRAVEDAEGPVVQVRYFNENYRRILYPQRLSQHDVLDLITCIEKGRAFTIPDGAYEELK